MSNAHSEKKHDYHLVDPSPWPLVGSISTFILAVGAVMYFISRKEEAPNLYYMLPGFALVLATFFFWWRDVIREAEHEGHHTPVVQLHLRYGMLLFIASEVMFFVAWFWAFFDISLFPAAVSEIEGTKSVIGMVQRNELTGGQWPPQASEHFKSVFDPWKLPLVNTLILLTSGTTVTWAHHALVEGDRKGLIWGLTLTVLLGMIFTVLQAYEYGHAAFDFSGHIYGATFYMATGFHGFHVVVGTIFLAVILFRALKGHFTPKHHFGFEAAAWYWHFVDVVWLFLFVAIYIWGAGGQAGH